MPLPANARRTSLTIPQVRMILRIYWTDKTRRRHAGYNRTTNGMTARLAKQFGVSIEVIRKIVAQRDNRKRKRFKSVKVEAIQQTTLAWVKVRSQQ